ncbi:hypothetical protein EKD00_09190 [Chlorobium phaeovibrioides]|uniref:hypothetical protein n=1 Tax=Chlorobium phaeovibrioides TaxID=1094 RepID=UPI000F8375A7|nr:hypothetical protein [Chlorobium phaeovibrioides]RTY33695.1 hypothetical protein EKD00_09190 [Chlorobium phaeovibrioides]
MSSLQRYSANRRNALRSTGPRTEDGKRRSSLNALRHGLYVPLLHSPWALLLEPMAELLLSEGLDAFQARELAESILTYERTLQHQRERYLKWAQGGEAGREHRDHGSGAKDMPPPSSGPFLGGRRPHLPDADEQRGRNANQLFMQCESMLG